MMDNTTLEIQDDLLVELTYVLSIEDDNAERLESKPHSKQFVQGHNKVVPGLEQALYGMTAGDEKDVVVKAADGYGEVDPDAIKTLSRKSIPATAEAKPGQRVRLLHKRSGEVHKATIVDVKPDTVVLDFNHPLAGKTLTYHVRVNDVRPAPQVSTDTVDTGSNSTDTVGTDSNGTSNTVAHAE